MSNDVLNGDAQVEGDKHKLWSGYRIGDNLVDRNLCMGRDEIRILAHMLNRKTLVIHIKIDNGKK